MICNHANPLVNYINLTAKWYISRNFQQSKPLIWDEFVRYTKFAFKCGVPANSIHSELVAVHGDATPCLRMIQRWVESMKSGSFRSQKKPNPGKPVTSVTGNLG